MRKKKSDGPPLRGDETPRDAVRRISLGLLARREHGRRELELKLLARGFAVSDIGPELDVLEQARLLSDERFAEQFVGSRVRRGDGPLKIRAELKGRGVQEGLIEKEIAQTEENWLGEAERVRCRKFGEPIPDTFEERARQARFLQNRGFTMEQIRRVLKGDIEDV